MTTAAKKPGASAPAARSPHGKHAAVAPKAKTGYEIWQEGIDRADAKWDGYDCDIQTSVNEYNRHLSRTSSYFPLDWRLVKAMVWTETGADSPQWAVRPVQIGNAGDLGLVALLGDKEGGDLIIPPAFRSTLTVSAVSTLPTFNIRAGIGYLLMRLANFEIQSVLDKDATVNTVVVKSGDSIDKIARAVGSTPEVMKRLNPSAQLLRPGTELKYQKAAVQKVITGWKIITTANAGTYYNAGGDALYARKLDYTMAAIRNRTEAACK